jgi:hypothetical protein
MRLKLNFAIEVSEILEVLLLTSQSDLVGLVPRNMLTLARCFPTSCTTCGGHRENVPPSNWCGSQEGV